jgi:predicted RNase H-like HicB family nuclease
MRRQFTLEYWQDDGWYVGRLKEAPGVLSQGETIQELEENIQDAYELMLADEMPMGVGQTHLKQVELEI